MSVSAFFAPSDIATHVDQHVILHGLRWTDYEALLAMSDPSKGYDVPGRPGRRPGAPRHGRTQWLPIPEVCAISRNRVSTWLKDYQPTISREAISRSPRNASPMTSFSDRLANTM